MRSGERERERWVSFQIDGCGIVSARAKPRLKRSLVQLQPVSKYPTLNLFPPPFFSPQSLKTEIKLHQIVTCHFNLSLHSCVFIFFSPFAFAFTFGTFPFWLNEACSCAIFLFLEFLTKQYHQDPKICSSVFVKSQFLFSSLPINTHTDQSFNNICII